MNGYTNGTNDARMESKAARSGGHAAWTYRLGTARLGD